MGGRDGGGTTSKAGGSAEGEGCEIGLLLLMENMLHQLMTCFLNNMYIYIIEDKPDEPLIGTLNHLKWWRILLSSSIRCAMDP